MLGIKLQRPYPLSLLFKLTYIQYNELYFGLCPAYGKNIEITVQIICKITSYNLRAAHVSVLSYEIMKQNYD